VSAGAVALFVARLRESIWPRVGVAVLKSALRTEQLQTEAATECNIYASRLGWQKLALDLLASKDCIATDIGEVQHRVVWITIPPQPQIAP
jgi:hypothetical protein